MGAVEHLKTMCCLGLPPESAMIAVTPLLHEIVPHGATRTILFEPDATIGAAYAENPETIAVWLANAWRFVDDPTSPMSLFIPGFRAMVIGWTLHLQGRGWLESGWYRNVELPLDSCWILDAAIGAGGRTIAGTHLTRPRSARPFTVDDVQRLDQARPWRAHAFGQRVSGKGHENPDLAPAAGAPVLSGRVILTSNAKIIFQKKGLEHLLEIIQRGPADLMRYVPLRDRLPVPVLKLVRRIVGAASGSIGEPPRMQISTPSGIVTLEAKWLMPAGTMPADVAKDPKSCHVGVMIELREHAIARAARVLRESGATPTQVKVGIQLALGKTKLEIAGELGIKPTSVMDLARKLYQTLDVHNSSGLATRIWLGERQRDERGHRMSGAQALIANGARRAQPAPIFRF